MGRDSWIDQAAQQGVQLKLLVIRAAQQCRSVSKTQLGYIFVLSFVMSATTSSDNQTEQSQPKVLFVQRFIRSLKYLHEKVYAVHCNQQSACDVHVCVRTLSSSSISEIFLSRALFSCSGEEKRKFKQMRTMRVRAKTRVAQTHTLRDAELTRRNETWRLSDYSTRTRTQTHSNASMVTRFTRLWADLADWKLCNGSNHTRFLQKCKWRRSLL